jgi:hypothetical protein
MEDWMRKLLSIAGAAVLAVTTYATPASAQAMSGGGSCGKNAGETGLTDINSSQVNTSGETVPALFYTVNYAGVPAPTTVGVIIRYNGEVETQVAVASVTANSSGGSFDGAIRANIDPSAQGFANSIGAGVRGRADGGESSHKVAEHGNQVGNSGERAGLQGSPTQGGLLPGDYVFYIYTGSIGDVFNVKDGTVSRSAFIADEKGFLGSFSCGVSTEDGSGPG